MKFKGLTKLAMSGVALAAVAATLGTSTYAWYVINPEATVTNITASTTANGETSILVSKDGETFSGKIAFAAADFASNNAVGNSKSDFVPVTTTDAKTFYDMDNYEKLIVNSEDTTAETSNSYLKFSVWVKAGAPGNVAAMLSVTNTTGIDDSTSTVTLPGQYAYQAVTASKAATSTFTVDAVQALRTAVFIDNATTASKVYDTQKIAYTSAYDAENKYTPLGDVTDNSKLSASVYLIESGTTTASLSGAHLYYTQVMNEEPVTTAPAIAATTASDLDNVTIATANVPVKLTFYIWLEGGDDLCFDACGGQNFEFGLKFMAAKANNDQNNG